jgi:alcohol dehydrogenase (cytochrome c)
MKTRRYLLIFALVSMPLAVLAQNAPYQRLLHADDEPQNWLMYNGDYQSNRFSRLKQINKQNVANLRPAWVYQPSRTGLLESSPVVFDGLIYLVEAPDTVTCLDARNGTKIWSWTPVSKETIAVGVNSTNRGVAVLDSTVYLNTFHDHLVALDAKTGAVRWDTTVVENDPWSSAYAMTGAPLAIDGKVIVGVGGGEGPIRGFVDAYDAKTGKQLWRVWTVPKPGESGSETWSGSSSLAGGGATWNRGSYDPELNLIYWGTGNPAPDYNGNGRLGDNLYTCSMLAIDAATGKVKWYFQFSPHETHDWDSVQVPVLFDAAIDGKPRKLLAQANRNGFYYVLDRTSGEFIAGTPFVKQTWAKGLDDKGRPIQMPDNEPTPKGNTLWPSVIGGTNWTSPSYDPDRKTFYVNAREMAAVYILGGESFDEKKPLRSQIGGGGGMSALSGDDAYGAIRALDVTTGKMKWEFRMHAPAWTSVVSTAGGVVFGQSDEGNFFALDSDSGKPLWNFSTGGVDPRANPVTYEIDGKQYVLTASGNIFMAFSLP